MIGFSEPRSLLESDPIEGFCCGTPLIDSWLQRHAKKARVNGTAVIYVSFDNDGRLAGFYSLSAHSIDRGRIRGWLGRNTPEPIPVILLGMLGVDKAHSGEGLGRQLLLDAFHRARGSSEVIGAKALLVEPLDDGVRGFYESCGFGPIRDSKQMYVRL